MLVKIVCMVLGAIMASVAIGLAAVVRADSRRDRMRAKEWEQEVDERVRLYGKSKV